MQVNEKKKKGEFDKNREAPLPGEEWGLFLFITILGGD